jgi:hypothetical protein
MSLPQFDPEVTLQSALVGGAWVTTDEFTATGPLRLEEEARVLRVFVSIWQTDADIAKNGSPTIAARALGEGKQDPNNKKKWSAKLTMLDGKSFTVDRPATGIGHIVEDYGDPTGFLAYTWTSRLQIKGP